MPWWLLAVGLLFVLGFWAITADATYSDIFQKLSGGVLTTLWVTLLAFALATVLGLLIALARTSNIRVLREIATFYVEIIRGIPILVFLFYIAFVGAPALVGAFNWVMAPFIEMGWLAPATVRGFDFVWRAILALTICYSAFIAEIFRAGIEAVGRGQVEAARSLGLSRIQCFRLVIMPQALRTILPPLGNDFVSMVKDSALVSALGVQDITQLGCWCAGSKCSWRAGIGTRSRSVTVEGGHLRGHLPATMFWKSLEDPMHKFVRLAVFGVAALALAACGNRSEVGNVGVDWTGNDISIEAVADPDVQGVVCHLAFFNRSFIDRISQGNWFADLEVAARHPHL
jgi:polar amino acid transport system permease protein